MPALVAAAARGPLSGGDGGLLLVRLGVRPAARAPPNTSANTASKARTCARSVTNTPRAIQYSRGARHRPPQLEGAREPDGAVRCRVHAGLVQAAAEGGGHARQVEVERATVNAGPVIA